MKEKSNSSGSKKIRIGSVITTIGVFIIFIILAMALARLSDSVITTIGVFITFIGIITALFHTEIRSMINPEKRVYIVTFDANGGIGGNKRQKIKSGESKLLNGGTPTRNGYTFMGWATSPTATIATHLNNNWQTVSGNATMFAVWTLSELVYSVTFDSNGGRGGKRWQTFIADEPLLLDGGTPTRDGYEFMGWATTPTATTSTHLNNNWQTVGGNIKLYAVWRRTIEEENPPLQ